MRDTPRSRNDSEGTLIRLFAVWFNYDAPVLYRTGDRLFSSSHDTGTLAGSQVFRDFLPASHERIISLSYISEDFQNYIPSRIASAYRQLAFRPHIAWATFGALWSLPAGNP